MNTEQQDNLNREEWEYKVSIWITAHGSFESWLNANGSLGWELVQVQTDVANMENNCIFKRKIQQG